MQLKPFGKLSDMGIQSIMLTGDNPRTAAAIASQMNMDYRAELMPEGKVTEIKRLAAEGGAMMIGDGINDAPALAQASTGVAMGSGTDVALETADAAILRKPRSRCSRPDPACPCGDVEHPAECDNCAWFEGRFLGDLRARHHGPLDCHSCRHRCDRARHFECPAASEVQSGKGWLT